MKVYMPKRIGSNVGGRAYPKQIIITVGLAEGEAEKLSLPFLALLDHRIESLVRSAMKES